MPCVLQEKIQALLDRAQFMPSALSDVDFEVLYLYFTRRGHAIFMTKLFL